MKRFVLLLLFAALACGRDESVAEKSAAAYREAKAKGVAVGGGHDHGHQGAAPAATATVDHAAHGTMDHAAHADGATAEHAAHGGPAQHAQHTQQEHSQHRESTGGGHAQHTQHSASPDPHAAHRAPATTTAPDAHAAHRGVVQPSGLPPGGRPEAHTTPTLDLKPDAFDAPAPTAVAEAKKARGEQQSHEGAVFTCPMHPEVTSDKPGSCPKCGMALVEKK